MEPCKRIEIVIEKTLSEVVAARLVELGAPGYTLIDHASGFGDRGHRRGDEPMGTSTNCVFIIACTNDNLAQAIVEDLLPTVSRSGGICLVSEALWAPH